MRSFFRKLRWLTRRPDKEAELRDELRFHLDEEAEQRQQEGLDGQEARWAARRELGNLTRVQEDARAAWGGTIFDEMRSDLLFATRSIRKHILLSIVVVVTLALGIGVNAGVFSVINAVAFRPRIDRDPESFLHIYPTYTQNGAPRGALQSTLPDFIALQRATRTLQHLTAWSGVRAPYSLDDPTEFRGLLVACNFFSVYTLPQTAEQPLLGRLLTEEDCQSARPVILISEAVWRNRLGADPLIVGKLFPFNQQPLTVIGVLPVPYAGGVSGGQVWMPYTLQPYLKMGGDQIRAEPARPWLLLGGRLNDGFTRQAAAAELQTIVARQDVLHTGRRTSIAVSDGSWLGHPQMRAVGIWTIPLILGAVGCVVLIASANVAALLLARASSRQREIAIRLALGAGRFRLVRMLLCESLLLTSIAGLAGLYLAYRVPTLIKNSMGGQQGTEFPFDPDWHVFVYLSAITILAGCMAGTAPALESLRVQLVDALKGRGGLAVSKPEGNIGLRRLLIAIQVALSVVLLIGAGVMARGAQHLLDAQSGDVNQVVLARISAPRQPNSTGFTLSTHRAIESRIRAVPGVASVAWTSPTFFARSRIELELAGRPALRAGYQAASPGYFTTMRVPILRGRDFQDSDSLPGLATMPVILTESLARQIWPGDDPLGKMLRIAGSTMSVEVVGVAKSTAMDSWGEDEGPLVYLPWRPDQGLHWLLVRSAGDPEMLSNPVVAAVKSELPAAVVQAKSIPSWWSEWTLGLRRIASMVALLGALALALTVIGIYGAVAFAVSRRTKEIAIRMALGARAGNILTSVIRGELRPILLGVAAGIALALPASVPLQKMMERSPFTIDTRDPIAYSLVCALFIAVAILAMLGPARRGAGTNPLIGLREE
jgi:predicted permease